MTKYYKRGLREFYSVGPEKVIRIISKEHVCEVTIANRYHSELLTTADMIISDLEAEAVNFNVPKEISRDEFKSKFEVASKLIVLE